MTKEQFVVKYAKKHKCTSHLIISAGRLHKSKGFDILIKSFSQIVKKLPDAMLFIAGNDDGELSNLQQLTNILSISDKVVFTGMINGQDKVSFFSNADIFVLPSHTENFGMVYAESLAAGTPIVASLHTPWKDIESAQCGRWVPNTVESTADAIIDLLGRDREHLRHNALQYIQKFNWPILAKQFNLFYTELITNNI